jgi:hypothetical protein
MKIVHSLATLALTSLVAPLALCAAEGKEAKKPKPYPLDTCIVSGEKLGADPNMKPYEFEHAGRQIKLCCKSCLKDFRKDAAGYLKKIDEAEKKPKQ